MADFSFEEDGIVSLWAGQVPVAPGSNFLRDGYGVEYYDPDFQECIVEDAITPIAEILPKLSYSASFREAALDAARRLGIPSCRWVMAQYDFAYDPGLPGLVSIPAEPVFLGRFQWSQ